MSQNTDGGENPIGGQGDLQGTTARKKDKCGNCYTEFPLRRVMIFITVCVSCLLLLICVTAPVLVFIMYVNGDVWRWYILVFPMMAYFFCFMSIYSSYGDCMETVRSENGMDTSKFARSRMEYYKTYQQPVRENQVAQRGTAIYYDENPQLNEIV
jgi:hypothetical protein